MNPLLKRQIRKYIPEKLRDNDELQAFYDAVASSYENYEDQFEMIQRAMMISSEELFEANKQLIEETKQQKKLVAKLQETLRAFKVSTIDFSPTAAGTDFDANTLGTIINKQAKELIEINIKQQKLLKNLEFQNQELNDYAHIVSHDLKSPLRNIYALLSWLREDFGDKIDSNGINNIKVIEDHLEKMDDLISGILRYSSIDRARVQEKPVDLNLIVDEVVASLPIPPYVSIKKLKLPTLTLDYFKLKQLFQNLIGNAVASIDKEEGFVTITAVEKGDFWKFSVADNGKGIKKDYYDKIFQIFQKLESDSGSTGIGLSIVKKIVHSFGGSIWLESEEGIGTTFFFTILKSATNEG